jgi:hypothetical protein
VVIHFVQQTNSTLKKTLITSHSRLHGGIRIRCQPCPKRLRIPRLHKHRARARKLTHQPLASVHIRQDPARRHALEHVFAVPRNEVAVIDDVLLVFFKLIVATD